MNRRDFLTLRTKGQRRIVELSCERLYMRYADARSGVGRWAPPAPIGKNQPAWEGEPPPQIKAPPTYELVDTLACRLPFSPREKQGLLEVPVVEDRYHLVKALCEFGVSFSGDTGAQAH